MKLTGLNCKCISNMPMLVDVIATTIDELDLYFWEHYNYYCDFLSEKIGINKKAGFDLKKKNKGTTVFSTKKIYGEKKFHLSYDISLSQPKKKAPSSFNVLFGYIIDDTQNSIYFQLIFKDKNDCEELISKINKDNIPADFDYRSDGASATDEGSVWVEFTPDENTSIEKIKKCSNIFKEQILIPYISKFE